MRSQRFVLTSVAGAIGNALKRAERLPREVGSCAVTLLTTPHGAGLTTAIRQAVETQGFLFAEIHADPTPRTVINAIYNCVFGDDGHSMYFGGDQTFGRVVRELRHGDATGISGPLIIGGANRLTPKLVDIVIDVGDSSGFGIVLCGNSRLRQLVMCAPQGGLAETARSHLALDVDVPGPTLRDARLLADELAEIALDGALVEYLYKKSGTSVRALLTDFRAVEEAAAVLGVERLALSQWVALLGECEAQQPQRKLAAPRSKTVVSEPATRGVKVA